MINIIYTNITSSQFNITKPQVHICSRTSALPSRDVLKNTFFMNKQHKIFPSFIKNIMHRKHAFKDRYHAHKNMLFLSINVMHRNMQI